jgi:hypothetical protein
MTLAKHIFAHSGRVPHFCAFRKVGLFPSAAATPKSFLIDTGTAYHFCAGREQKPRVPHSSLLRAGFSQSAIEYPA